MLKLAARAVTASSRDMVLDALVGSLDKCQSSWYNGVSHAVTHSENLVTVEHRSVPKAS